MTETPALRKYLPAAGLIGGLLLAPGDVRAHLVTTGMGPVYDGIGHLMLTPEDLVPAVAVALYGGLCGQKAGRHTLFIFPLAWLLGGAAGLVSGCTLTFPYSAFFFLVMGGLVAADKALPLPVINALIVMVGITNGFFNGLAMQSGPGFPGLLGIAAALFVLLALGTACVVSLKKGWTRIAVRVVGSWITAVGLLMFGWMARGAG